MLVLMFSKATVFLKATLSLSRTREQLLSTTLYYLLALKHVAVSDSCVSVLSIQSTITLAVACCARPRDHKATLPTDLV